MKLNRSHAIRIVVGLTLLAVCAFLLLKFIDVRALFGSLLAWIKTIGAGPFFIAMVLLPSVGFPLMAFSLAAGPAFGARLGLPLLCCLVVLSIMANLALTYWLSRRALRPFLEKWVLRFGYNLPDVPRDDILGFTVLVRVTPGPPFFVQNYLLGLAGVPFGMYMLVSTVFTGIYSVAVVLFGDSLVRGRGKLAILAVSGVIILSVLLKWLRRRLQKNKLERVASV